MSSVLSSCERARRFAVKLPVARDAGDTGPHLPVAVLGAGIAGLTAAWALRRLGFRPRIYEATDAIAGLASTYRDADGFSSDMGAHFITNRLAEALGIEDRCAALDRYGESVLVDTRAYEYPLGLLCSPVFLAGAVAARARRNERQIIDSAAAHFERAYGRPFARRIAIPLVEAWSGLPATQLSAGVADSIPSSVLQTLYLTLAGRLLQRPVAIGYSRFAPEHPGVWHVYPDDGIATVCRQLVDDDGELILNAPVERIEVERGRVVAIRVRGERHEVAAVVSTLPCSRLADIIAGTNALEPLRRFRFRPMTFVNLRFEGRGYLPNVIVWTPESRFPFFRLAETPLAIPWLAPPGKTLITADIGCELGDAWWTMDHDELGRRCLSALGEIAPAARERYLGCTVTRTPFAYPVFDLAYEQERRHFSQSLGIPGLRSIGRNGWFEHVFMEDIYWRTLVEMRSLAAELAVAR